MLTFFIIISIMMLVAVGVSFRIWKNSEKALAESIAQQQKTMRLMEKFREIDRKNEEAIRFAHASREQSEKEFWEEKQKKYGPNYGKYQGR